MRIVRVEVIPIDLPFRERYRTATGELSARSMIVVRVHAEGGCTGLGEAVPLSLRGGPGLGAIASELSVCGSALAGIDAAQAASGAPDEIRQWIWGLLGRCRYQGAGPQAIAALDVALHDLAGRLSGLPVWRLLGAAAIREVRCNATLDAGEPERVAAIAAEQRRSGFETFKVKVGVGDDRGRIEAVRAAVGSAARIRVDANGAWEPERATEMLATLEPYGIELAEQPCADLSGLASVRARTAIPIVADESVASAEEARLAIAARACDAATLKLAKVGGPLEALRISAMIPSYLSSALDGPIGIAAAVHTAQALPYGGHAAGFAHGLATLGMFAATYAPSSGLLAPSLQPPRSPGLGIEVDEATLAALRTS